MIIYTLHELDNDNEYEEMDTLLGVYSSIKNAENALHKAEKIFTNSEFFINEWELDDFSWENC